MNIENVYTLLEDRLEGLYGNKVQIDKERFEKDLQNKYEVQNLQDIHVPISILEKIATTPVSLKKYAELNGVSYSTMQKNYRSYSSVKKDGRNITLAEYEIIHNKRINHYLVKILTEFIHTDDALMAKFTEEATKRNIDVDDLIFEVVSASEHDTLRINVNFDRLRYNESK